MKGLKDNVTKLYDTIREVIFELKEAITISKMATWKWASASNVYTNLPLRVSRAVEAHFEVSLSFRILCVSSGKSFNYYNLS